MKNLSSQYTFLSILASYFWPTFLAYLESYGNHQFSYESEYSERRPLTSVHTNGLRATVAAYKTLLSLTLSIPLSVSGHPEQTTTGSNVCYTKQQQ